MRKGGYVALDLVYLLTSEDGVVTHPNYKSMYYEIVTRINDIMYSD